MRMKKKKKGFTLIELLATILIVSLVIGFSGVMINNIIKKANERKETLALNNIKKTASIYIEEYPDDVIWNQEEDMSYSCIAINSLIEKGYFSRNDIDNSKVSQYIIVKKNQGNTIIGEEFDDSSELKCNNNKEIVPIPTAKEYCSNPEYSGESQSLTLPSPESFSLEEREETEVGSYEVKATLNNEDNENKYVWKDYTSSPKKISCSIQKATPLLWISDGEENGDSGQSLGNKVIHLNASVDGKISIKSSNKSIVTAMFNDGNNSISRIKDESDDENSVSSEKEVTITIHSTTKSPVYITFELTPNDNSRYKKTSFVYTVGIVNKKEIPVPVCQSNLYSNGAYQNLVKPNEGYTLLNNLEKNVGTYTVTALLKYGYVWQGDNENSNSKKIQCSILASSFKLTYDSNGGGTCNPSSKDVSYNKKYGDLCMPSRENYDFVEWNENKDGSGKVISKDTTVTTANDHTIYAQWLKKAQKYTVTYNSNGGSACNPNTKTIVENGTYGSLCTTSRAGYRFDGWYTAASEGTKVISSSNVKNQNHTIYAHWTQTDKTNPTCGTQSPAVKSWTKNARTITISCTDKGGAGCEKSTYSKTFNESGKEVNNGEIVIKDNAGNTTRCKVKVMVDKKAPVVSITTKNNYSYQSDKKYCTERKTSTYQRLNIVKYYDNGSGLKSSSFTWPKGCIGCSNTGTQKFSRDCSGSFRYQTVTEGLCGRKGSYTYNVCDMVGNCSKGSISK